MSNPAYSEVMEDLLDRKELPSAAITTTIHDA